MHRYHLQIARSAMDKKQTQYRAYAASGKWKMNWHIVEQFPNQGDGACGHSEMSSTASTQMA